MAIFIRYGKKLPWIYQLNIDRIQKLREESLNAINRISTERALLVTEFYKSNQAQEVPILQEELKNNKLTQEQAKDYNAGGAKYNTSYAEGVGLGSITENLTSIRYNVFDEKKISMKDSMDALEINFEGHEELRHDLICETSKYGNDDGYTDRHAVEVLNAFLNPINGKDTARGGKYRINLLPTTSHVYFESVINAMPDGRKASEPLSEGIRPVQGADRKGPTALMKAIAKIDHIKTGDSLLNMKFSPSFFKDEQGISKFASLIRSYSRMDGHHKRFNVADADTLREVQKHPEKYADLIVRVAGYSDSSNDFGEDLQNEIIKRTEHETM